MYLINAFAGTGPIAKLIFLMRCLVASTLTFSKEQFHLKQTTAIPQRRQSFLWDQPAALKLLLHFNK
ncbi:hypothetical protein XELAEV_18025647mg [Xenopus laevis]|uniref:Uncharacterized protein n=1 Tax=Xenopus laevis TaxID=8355 RepID=A0A974D029_XENLA|nr:hypothetical protein XELAEV_18025647mg [Xenopus laevis]